MSETPEQNPAELKPIRTMDIMAIQKAIPHRYPFLLIDRVDVIEEFKVAVGTHCVTMNEWYFQGHFPAKPIMPGVLIVEALAQTGCALFLSRPEYANKLAFFMGINEVKFRRPVVPGDVLALRVDVLKASMRAGKVKGRATVNGELATEAEFTFALVDTPKDETSK